MCKEWLFSVGDDEIVQGLFFYFYFQRNIRLSVHLGRHPVSRLRRGRTRNFHRRLSLLSYRLKVKHPTFRLHVSSLSLRLGVAMDRLPRGWGHTHCMFDYRVRVAPSRVKSQYEKIDSKVLVLVIPIFGV